MKNLSCEDLMIGDWVMNTHSQKPERVCEILERMVMLDYNDLYEYDGIQPIPIVPEILEKNGFIEVKHYYPYPTYECAVDSQKFLIRVAFPKNSKATERTKPFVTVDSEWCWHNSDCEFFHKLQHVLRDCRIKKEMML